jgi:hypothetical protein
MIKAETISAQGKRLLKELARSAALDIKAAPKKGRPRKMTGFFSTLTDEQKQAALSYRGPENHGDPSLLVKKGRPRIEDRANSNEARKPWVELGMSRRTWYSRQAEKRKEKSLSDQNRS